LTVAMRHRDQHSVASLPRTDPFQGCSNIPLFSCQGAPPTLAGGHSLYHPRRPPSSTFRALPAGPHGLRCSGKAV